MKPGDKVVCVDDSPCEHCKSEYGTKLNHIFVVSETKNGSNANGTKGQRIRCLGVSFFCNCDFDDGFAPAYCFRLLDELKQEAKQRQQKEQTA